MKISYPQALNEMGGRKNNEDSIFPALGKSDSNCRLFLVCDGVGGQDKGEVASQIICKAFPAYIEKQRRNDLQVEPLLLEALKYAEDQINIYIDSHTNSDGMASTVTVLYLSDEGVALGWVGDSRIYHVRDGQILFRTKDHSLVQSLVDMGEITEEEAKNHPRKNVIERAVSGRVPARMDTHVISDVREGDFFLLCTDGVLETLDDQLIMEWMLADQDAETIKNKILLNASGKTRDNFSMYLVQVSHEAMIGNPQTKTKEEAQGKASKNKGRYVLIFTAVLVLILLSLATWFSIGDNWKNSTEVVKKDSVNVNADSAKISRKSNTISGDNLEEMPMEQAGKEVPEENEQESIEESKEPASLSVDSIAFSIGGAVKVLKDNGALKVEVEGSFRVSDEVREKVKEGIDRLVLFYKSGQRDTIQSPKIRVEPSSSLVIEGKDGKIDMRSMTWKKQNTSPKD